MRRGAPVGRRVPPPREAILRTWLRLLFLCAPLCHSGEDAGGVMGSCMERERKALLAVRADIWGAEKRLSSWERDHDCCRWEGVECDDRTGHVVKLQLNLSEFYRPGGKSKVNPALLNLTSLRYLDLSYNDFGGAPIPHFIGDLANLSSLILSYARFGGPIPPELGSLQKLQYLDLSGLSEVGNLFWLSHLSNLRYLNMSDVDLTSAPNWLHVINKLPSLLELRLRFCQLPNLPTVLPHVNFTSLTTLHLFVGYYFNATFPLWLFNISSLVELHLGYIQGPIPDGFGTLKHLERLSLEVNAFEGVIPASLWKLENLTYLSLSGQNLHFGLPQPMENLKRLQTLELDGVTGRLPESLGNLSSLRELRLWDSIIEGGLPESLGNLSQLGSLTLQWNNFSGGIPKSIGNLVKLKDLYLWGNNIAGRTEVNELIEGLTRGPGGSILERLVLTGNGFGGHIPYQVGQLSNLQQLDLAGNFIVGSIPASIGDLKSLTSLSLRENQLSGRIPESMGKLTNLSWLDLSSNNLSASQLHFHPKSPLRYLSLSNNQISGPILVSNGEILLEYLDLSHNYINGSIPLSLRHLKSLQVLDLSHNNLLARWNSAMLE